MKTALQSNSGLFIEKLEDGCILLTSTENNESHFIIPAQDWISATANIINRGIVGLNGIANINCNVNLSDSSVELQQGEIKIELTQDNVDCLCDAIESKQFIHNKLSNTKKALEESSATNSEETFA